MVWDRLLLWIFSICSLIGTVLILAQAPSFRDHRRSIDNDFRKTIFYGNETVAIVH